MKQIVEVLKLTAIGIVLLGSLLLLGCQTHDPTWVDTAFALKSIDFE